LLRSEIAKATGSPPARSRRRLAIRTDMHDVTTYLCFWDIALLNLPVGTVRRLVLTPSEACSTIKSARARESLICVASADLVAPYASRDRDRHEQLCSVLRGRFGIEIWLNDFLGLGYAPPLTSARVDGGCQLLIVDCAYQIDEASHASGGRRRGEEAPMEHRSSSSACCLTVAPNSITFNMIRRVEC
jgi:hypothetical protein